MVILQENKRDGCFFVTVPKDLAAAKGWTKGQQLFFCFNERGDLALSAAPRLKEA